MGHGQWQLLCQQGPTAGSCLSPLLCWTADTRSARCACWLPPGATSPSWCRRQRRPCTPPTPSTARCASRCAASSPAGGAFLSNLLEGQGGGSVGPGEGAHRGRGGAQRSVRCEPGHPGCGVQGRRGSEGIPWPYLAPLREDPFALLAGCRRGHAEDVFDVLVPRLIPAPKPVTAARAAAAAGPAAARVSPAPPEPLAGSAAVPRPAGPAAQ